MAKKILAWHLFYFKNRWTDLWGVSWVLEEVMWTLLFGSSRCQKPAKSNRRPIGRFWHIGWRMMRLQQIRIFGQLDIAISVRLRGDSTLRCECFRGSSDTWALHLRKQGNKCCQQSQMSEISWKSQFYQWFSFFILVLYRLHRHYRWPFWGLASFALDSAIFWWDERFAPYTPSREMHLNLLPASSHRVRFPILSATMMNTLHTFPATLCEKFRFPFFNFTKARSWRWSVGKICWPAKFQRCLG